MPMYKTHFFSQNLHLKNWSESYLLPQVFTRFLGADLINLILFSLFSLSAAFCKNALTLLN